MAWHDRFTVARTLVVWLIVLVIFFAWLTWHRADPNLRSPGPVEIDPPTHVL